MILRPGELFRRYRILEKAGEGGMGIVYRAHDTRLGRDVALKFVTQVGECSAEYTERLRREAMSLGALNHPNIVTIHDFDEADGVPFLVLEWIDGKSLTGISVKRRISIEEFNRLVLPVAEALASAHDRGIIHRDVKPSNVLVSNDGQVKVVDFGLAKFRDADQDAILTAGTVGTVVYMSPEQASGADLGPASDIFSFGILAYELLTGELPFKGNGLAPLLSAIINGRHLPVSNLRRDLPVELEAIVERCLETEPRSRFQGGRQLADALRRVAVGVGSSDIEQVTTKFLPLPSNAVDREQDIRFCETADGMRIAYSAIGNGPMLVRVLGFFTHLEVEWEWPDLRHLWERLAEQYTVIRYDGRGIGLSDRFTSEFTEETRQLDLDAVLTAVGAEDVTLFGISEGGWTAATYSNNHPKLISRLVLYGAYCRGAQAKPGYDPEEDRAIITLIRKGWGRDTPAFRQVITSQFFQPDADHKLIGHFNDMQRASADPDTAARYQESCHARGDGGNLYRQVKVPTLVMQCSGDMAVPAEEGRLLASVIPGARLVMLPSGGHYFPTDREVVTKVVGTITRFMEEGEGR